MENLEIRNQKPSTPLVAAVTRLRQLRERTVSLCHPLEVEDYVVQPLDEVSPPKWHLAHTTWFFEEMLLVPFVPDYRRFDETYAPLFNSYYCLLYTSPSPRDRQKSRMPSSA